MAKNMSTLEQQDQIPTAPDSLLLSPEDLTAKQAKWQAEGYGDEDIAVLTKMLKKLSEMQDFERSFIAQGEEYWKEHPEELKVAEQKRKEYEEKRKRIKYRRETIRNTLTERNRTGWKIEQDDNGLGVWEGHDPEKLLTKVFDWMKHMVPDKAADIDNLCWAYGGGYVNLGMSYWFGGIPRAYIDRKVKKDSDLPDVKYNWPEQGSGLEDLLEKLKGKKVLSLIADGDHWEGEWLLKIIEPKKGEPKVFNHLNGTSIETDGMTEKEGFPFKVGDCLKLKSHADGYSDNTKKAIREAKVIKVVGFVSEEGENEKYVVIQLDDSGVFTSSCSYAEQCFEKIN